MQKKRDRENKRIVASFLSLDISNQIFATMTPLWSYFCADILIYWNAEPFSHVWLKIKNAWLYNSV